MILYGTGIADRILFDLKETISFKRLKLKLAVVLVGNDKKSEIYVAKKGEAARKVGIDFELIKLSADISEVELESEVKKVVADRTVSGIVVQLPLPKSIDAKKIIDLLGDKDAEAVSPVVCAISQIIDEYQISLKGKKIVLVGSGILVGGPVGRWLKNQGLDFFGIDEVNSADIVISGAGQRNLIKRDMIKEGAVIIDVGGDADFENLKNKAGSITPIVGGVGPVTVACLLKSLVKMNS